MKNLSSREIRENLSDILSRVAYKHQKFTLSRNRKKIAVIISIEEWEKVEKLLEHFENEEDIRDADEAHIRYLKEGGVSLEQAKKELNLE